MATIPKKQSKQQQKGEVTASALLRRGLGAIDVETILHLKQIFKQVRIPCNRTRHIANKTYYKIGDSVTRLEANSYDQINMTENWLEYD